MFDRRMNYSCTDFHLGSMHCAMLLYIYSHLKLAHFSMNTVGTARPITHIGADRHFICRGHAHAIRDVIRIKSY